MKKSEFFKSDLWTILRSILVLSVIAVVAGALLGCVNYFTAVDEQQLINDSLKALYPGADSFTQHDELISETDSGEVLKIYTPDGKDGVYIYLASGKGYGGAVKLFVVVTDDVVSAISVYEASETAGLGDTLLKKGEYFQQFVGVNLSGLTAFTSDKSADVSAKDGAVVPKTGTTKTSNAVIYALSAVAQCHNANVGGDR